MVIVIRFEENAQANNYYRLSFRQTSPAGGQWFPAPPISRLAHRLLHTSNTVFKKCAPPSSSWPHLLLNPGDEPAFRPQKK